MRTVVSCVAILVIFASASWPQQKVSFTFTSIDYPGTTFGADALGINDSGQIVGVYGSGHGFLDDNGQFTSIDYPGATQTVAYGINNQGDVVGSYGDISHSYHGFILSGGTFQQLDFPGAVHTFARSINSMQQIVGFYVDSLNASHGFLYSSEIFKTVDYSGPGQTVIYGINDSTELVGKYCYLVCRGVATENDLFRFYRVRTTPYTEADGIDSKGQVVGWFTNADESIEYGFLYSRGHYFPLSYPSSTGTFAMGINSLSSIVGSYYDSSGNVLGFIAVAALTGSH